ncbi:hypothetical protein [Roseateles asaccharophilus]|uniref:Uncharacterized protein n=1 Tax=Roseateles asaccharophilus TaxID=582607 RepID=A0ABU2A5L3_9BURK|nr:hypothetical protein [Roseateles asaccharophilus]MDR7332454.1 hypothetical protein [Roseateles asaccharophilus]
MQTWLDLESRFRALAPRLKFGRLDAQWGAAGEHWHIAGGADQLARQEFELLSAVAGRFLEQVYSAKDPDQSKLLLIEDPRARWYTLLKQFAGVQNLLHGQQLHDDGSPAGSIYSGTVTAFVESSANLCLALHTKSPIVERQSKWKWFHDNYGKALIVGVALALVGAGIKLIGG